MQFEIEIQFERISLQMRLRGVGHDKHYRDIRAGDWPKIIKDGRNSNGLKHEREAICAAKAAGANKDEVRALVKELEELRSRLLKAWRERIQNAS